MSAGATIKLRRDTAAAWTAANPILAAGEPGLETDTDLIKYGDGVTAWNSLGYSAISGAVGGDLVPVLDNTYSLGNATNRWRDVFVAGNSIYVGNLILSDDGSNTLAINGTAVATVNESLSNKGADSNNWNSLITLGLYTVNRVSWSGVTGAPLDSQVFIGTLEVLVSSTVDTTSVTQNFYPGAQLTDAAIQFTRSYWNGTWTNWQKTLNTQQVVSGGEF